MMQTPDVYTTDRSGLAAQRTKLTNPDAHVVLPEIISKEPLGPVVRQGDDEWFNIVRWSHNAMINAEELGVTQANVGSMISQIIPPLSVFWVKKAILVKSLALAMTGQQISSKLSVIMVSPMTHMLLHSVLLVVLTRHGTMVAFSMPLLFANT